MRATLAPGDVVSDVSFHPLHLQLAIACFHGRPLQADSIKPSFLKLNATRLLNLDRANDVSSHDNSVQVDGIKARVERAYGVCNQRLKLK